MKKVRLKDVLTVKRGASLSGDFYSNNGKYIRLTLGNFAYPGGGFKANTSKNDLYFIGKIKPEFILKKGDIITPLTEQVRGLLGETATIPLDNTYIQSGDIGLIIPNEKILDKRFAYYLISSSIIKKQLDAGSQQTKIRHTSPEAIMNCIAFLPDIDEQISIASFLDKINTKLETNNAIISELEAMAKDIYDYWFVQFDFPDENGKPYKSSGGKMVWNEELKREIPEGWKVKTLNDSYNISRGISYTSESIATGQGVPMINLACVDINRNYRPGELKYFEGSLPEEMKLKPNSMLIACTDLTRNRDIIGCPILVPEGDVYTFSMDMAKIESSDLEIENMYLYMTLRTESYHNFIKRWASGTNVLHLNLDGINWYPVCIPPLSLQKELSKIVLECHLKKCACLKENSELRSLRDFLLPLLMNGQVKVGDMEA